MTLLDHEVFRFADRSVMPWRNGAGSTRELLVGGREASSGGFDWRISVADVTAPGPFSSYPGVDRVLVLCAGAGMVLDVDGRGHHLENYDALGFAGEQTTSATLVDGPTVDLNVMTRRDRVQARVEVAPTDHLTIQQDHPRPPGGRVLVVALQNVALRVDGRELSLSPFDGVFISDSTCDLTATGGRCAVVTLTSAVPERPVVVPDRPAQGA